MGKSVLIVDDDPDQHVLLGLYLRHAGYAVLHAYDGAEGYHTAVSEIPSLVLLDMRMPRTDGASAFRQLRGDPATASIPVVAVTADVLTWPESRSLREGFAGHVTKPCDLSRIKDVVSRIIGPPNADGVPKRTTFVAAAMH